MKQCSKVVREVGARACNESGYKKDVTNMFLWFRYMDA